MAEGGLPRTESGSGSPHPKSSTDIRKDHQFDAYLLECPICLEQMRQPKSLPCLHSFCQECLSTYIVKDLSEKTSVTAFPCPVCRKIAQPVNSSESKETWAEQFPTNTLIEGLLILKQKADEPLYCKPCKKTKQLSIPASIWCKSINALFCDSCKVSYHDILHDDCHTVDVTGNLLSFQKSSNVVRCSYHKKTLDYYCEDHQIVGCATCIILDHRGCGGVKTTEEYCQQMNYPDIDNSLEKANDTMDILVKDLDEQVEVMLKDQDTGLGSITERRQRLDAYLDQKQKEITDQFIAVHKEEKAKVELTIQKCDRLRTGMKHTRETLATARTGNDYQEIILLYQRGQAEIKSCGDLVVEMTTDSITVCISHEVDVIHCDLSQDSSLTLGSVRVQKHPRLLPDLSGVSVRPPLIECQIKKIGSIGIQSTSDDNFLAYGVVYLPGDLIVVNDYGNYCIKLFTDTDERLDELQISGCPNDICVVDNNTVAVAVSEEDEGIHVVKVEDQKLSLLSKIKLPGDKPCHGITYAGDRFIVTTPKEMYSVTQKGKGVRLCNFPVECENLAYDEKGGRTIVSHNTSEDGTVAVSIMSADRTTDFLEVGVVKGAWGVDVDREGNVYVCGQDSNNVVQISADGKHVRELLTSSDGAKVPRAIAVRGDKFVLTNNATYEQDTINVYQLY